MTKQEQEILELNVQIDYYKTEYYKLREQMHQQNMKVLEDLHNTTDRMLDTLNKMHSDIEKIEGVTK